MTVTAAQPSPAPAPVRRRISAILRRPDRVHSRHAADYAGALLISPIVAAGPSGAAVVYQLHHTAALTRSELRDVLAAILDDLGGTL